MNEHQILRLCAPIRDTALALHRYHRHGHLAKIYERFGQTGVSRRAFAAGRAVSESYDLTKAPDLSAPVREDRLAASARRSPVLADAGLVVSSAAKGLAGLAVEALPAAESRCLSWK